MASASTTQSPPLSAASDAVGAGATSQTSQSTGASSSRPPEMKVPEEVGTRTPPETSMDAGEPSVLRDLIPDTPTQQVTVVREATPNLHRADVLVSNLSPTGQKHPEAPPPPEGAPPPMQFSDDGGRGKDESEHMAENPAGQGSKEAEVAQHAAKSP
mmetsp:Transcript_79453/g.140567  ORF Transcript_79453/g.140567 Transcript_79453/m.140567 type:complete len:157 (+) Transcript_79453:2-472(+)